MLVSSRSVSMLSLFCAGLLAGQVQAYFDPTPEDYVDWVATILDETVALPPCSDVGVANSLECQALCEALDDEVDIHNTRDVNGAYTCACETLVGCNDSPTCAQLTIYPGSVSESCTEYCGDKFVAFEDYVEYTGGESNTNKNRTHFVLECRCDGVTECSDYLLFSDLWSPTNCTSLSISSNETCASYCDASGGDLFDLGYTYSDDEGVSTCMCLGTDATTGEAKEAQACTDIPVILGPDACTLQDPCPTPAPTAAADGNGSTGPSGGDADGSMRINMLAAVVASIAGLLLVV